MSHQIKHTPSMTSVVSFENPHCLLMTEFDSLSNHRSFSLKPKILSFLQAAKLRIILHYQSHM